MKNMLLILAVALAAYGCASTPADPAADSAAAAPVEATTAATDAAAPVATETVVTPIDTAAAEDESSASESKLICKSTASTGSRLSTRQCKTAAQIELDKQNAKEATSTYQRDGSFQKKKGF